MRILFLTDNYPPETNAPAARTYEHARYWVSLGHSVTIITGAPNFPIGKVYPGHRNWPLSVTWEDGIRVIRVWSYIAPNAGFFRRTLDFLSYCLSASLVAPLLPFDVLVATSPQFFTAFAGWYTATLRRKPWIFELRDLWPESIRTVGMMRNGIAFRSLECLERFLYRQSTRVVSVTQAFRRNLIDRGIRSGKITVIPNGVDTTRFDPCTRDGAGRSMPGPATRPVIGYLGTHGISHALDFVISVAREREDADFVFVGTGAEKQKLCRLSAGMPNVRLLDPVPKEDVPGMISSFDYALVNLRDITTFRTVIPSKIFENAAMEVPILLGVDGEAKEIINRYQAGITFHPENRQSFHQAIDQATESIRNGSYQQMQQGCRDLAREYDRKKLAETMLRQMESILQ